MAGTFYVDFVAGSSGDGSTGSPYSNLIYALAQRTAETGAVILKCRGNTNPSYDVGAPIDITGHSFSTLVIEPDTGWEWSGADPQLTLWTDNANEDLIDIDMNGVTIRGFRLEHRREGSGRRPVIRFGSGITDSSVVVENCKLFSNTNVVYASQGNATLYSTVRNSLLANYSDDFVDDKAYAGGNGNIRLHNCVIAGGGGQAFGASTTGSNTASQVINCVFLDYSDAMEDGITFGTVQNNATEGTDPGDIGSTPVTGVVAGDFTAAAIANPRTGGHDFRIAASSTLDGQGTALLSTDAFGTTYENPPPIGYHQPAASGTTIPIFSHHLRNNTGSGL